MLFAHLNLAQRYQIQTRLAAAQPVAVIARALGVHRSTVYRELERGAVQEDYQAERAQARAKQRRVSSAANHPVKPPSLWQQVRRLLRRYWSPEQIAGRGPLEGGQAVSTQATYAWLKRTGSALTTRLRHYRALMPWRTSTGDLPKTRPSIRQRPSEVHQRHTLGHWEGDTLMGRSRRECLVTLVALPPSRWNAKACIPACPRYCPRRPPMSHTRSPEKGTSPVH